MRVLLLAHAFNSLAQRLFVELTARGDDVSVELDINDAVAIEAVSMFEPDLVVAPYLKRAISPAIWSHLPCLVVHPGIRGDRGPSALDWAIFEGEPAWGVTVLQANAVMDGGDIWAHREFPMREATKASIYRQEVTSAAVEAVLEALGALSAGGASPQPLDYNEPDIRGSWRGPMTQEARAIDWKDDDTATVLRKIRSADGFPGLRDDTLGHRVYLYHARPAADLGGDPGTLVARRGDAICRATADSAVWIGHLRDPAAATPIKLPAVPVLRSAGIEVDRLPDAAGGDEIRYEESGPVGFLYFPFYNGAMGTDRCKALLAAYRTALRRPTRVLVLMGGEDFWSNGMDLNLIEAADDPADASLENINAIDDLAAAIIRTESHVTVAALRGNAGAGGVFLARAADMVWCRRGVVLNPHYKDMGNLYGSEYWTYLLPRCAGPTNSARITNSRLPMGAAEALDVDLVDRCLDGSGPALDAVIAKEAKTLAEDPTFTDILERKRERRKRDERAKPLARYREEELQRMRLNFYGFDPSYHIARYNFVHKVPKSRTPLTIARHRSARARTPRAR